MDIAHIITQLETLIQQAYESGNKYDFIDPACGLFRKLEALNPSVDVVEPLFRLIERSPHIDYGGPGPMGGFLERFYKAGYEGMLLASIGRKPTIYTLYLLGRCINDSDNPQQPYYLSLMRQIASDLQQPEHIRREALEHLDIIQERMTFSSSMEKAESLLQETQEHLAKRRQEVVHERPPVPFLEFGGITFKVINREQAKAFMPVLTDMPEVDQLYDVYDEWRFPIYLEGGFFLLAEGDVVTDKLELDYSVPEVEGITILGFIFLQDLTVHSHVLAFDTDNSPAFIVHGRLQCPTIHLFGNVHYVGGGTRADLIWARYNHGQMFLNGNTTAKAIFADDMLVFIRKPSNHPAFIASMDMNIFVRQADGKEWLVQPSTHGLEAVFLPELLTRENGCSVLDDAKAVAYLKAGKSLLQNLA